MLEAMNAALAPAPTPADGGAPLGGQPRDELGRFTFKDAAGNAVDAQGNLPPGGAVPAAPGAAQAPGAAAPAVAKPEDDLLAMPEGLQPKAQERFQRLANTNRELTTERDQYREQLTGLQQVFQEHQVQQPQFEQAVEVIGMINRGDFAAARQFLLDQLQQIAVLSGEPIGSVDALAEFPDLRQQVDGFLLSEENALQLARARKMQQIQHQQAQQQGQRQQQEQAQRQQQQAQQQAVETGLSAIDTFCKQMQTTDLDYQVIEEQLLPVIPELIKGVPPDRWATVVKLQYQAIKNTAGKLRQTLGQQPGTVLRATGQASPAAAPKTMAEAMWGNSAPR